MKQSINLDHLQQIKGHNYEQPFNLNKFIESLGSSGFQASNLKKAIDIAKIMLREQADIFLASTSNMISSGNREAITYLCKHKKIKALIITAGGIEEDIIKLLSPFRLGDFSAPGEHLFENGVNRTGNLFVANDCYTQFDKFMQNFLKSLEEKPTSTRDFTTALGKAAAKFENHEESYLYWAQKNNIPVICPALMDGSLGDLIHFHRQQHKDFTIETSSDMDHLVNLMLNANKAAGIILGGGVAKHYLLNCAIFREGLDYTIYINTGQEFDGSDSGARIDEAISWGKVKPRTPSVKVHCDATIAFPLLMVGAFTN